jgi:hypothetical protein
LERSISINEFVAVIKKLPEDEPRYDSRVWYVTQKEHWLGWLSQYDGPGAYDRKTGGHDAAFAYNHIQCPGMLLWIIEAAGLDSEVVEAARSAANGVGHHSAKVAAIRRCAPWSLVYHALFEQAPTRSSTALRHAHR